MESRIRLATTEDADRISRIYAPIVGHTAISFEVDPPTAGEMAQRIENTTTRLPWLVLERDGKISGYAYATAHSSRAAYSWSVDVSAYVDEPCRGTGVGRALYTALLAVLKVQGYYNAYAGIALPNPASVRLHESVGFRPVGIYQGVGYKLGAWHDVGWWQLSLREKNGPPDPPKDLAAVMRHSSWKDLLSKELSPRESDAG